LDNFNQWNFLKGYTGSGVAFGPILATDLPVMTSSQLPSNTVYGTGTSSKIPYLSASSPMTIADSPITVSGSNVSLAAGSAVGIGTATPTTQLDISQSASASIRLAGTTSGGKLQFTDGTNTHSIGFQGLISSATTGTVSTDFIIQSQASRNILFNIGSGNELMRINATNGFVGISNTSPSVHLHVGSSSVASATAVAKFTNADGTCTLTPVTGLACSSDERLKENIEQVTGTYALDHLIKMQAVTYSFKSDSLERKHTGYIAQEIQKIAPEFVRKNEDGYLQVITVDYPMDHRIN